MKPQLPSPGTSSGHSAPLEFSPEQQPPLSRPQLFWLLAVFFLIQKGTNNVLYLTWLASLLKNLGSAMLPWAYLAGNIAFIALQYSFVRRMAGHEGHWMLSSLSLPVVLFSFFTTMTIGNTAGVVLLIGVVGAMVTDLLTNQAFSAMANQLLSLQEAKRRLPAIFGAGSAGYILSGILMKTILDFVGTQPLLWLNTAMLCAGAVVLQKLGPYETSRERDSAGTGDSAAPQQAAAGAPPSSFRQPLAALLVFSSILIVFNRFLIDYLFSTSVTAHFGDAASIASFLGLFGAATDFTVIILQLTVMNWVFANQPIGRILLLTPFFLTILCLGAAIHPAFSVVAATQFVVLLNSKNFTVPATTLLLGAFPAKTRGIYRRDISTVSSAASIAASLVLLAARNRVSTGSLFLIAGVCYGIMLLVHSRLDNGYSTTLRETLAGTGGAPDNETLRSVGFLPENERLLRLQELLIHPDSQVKLEAIDEIERLSDDLLRRLLFPRLSEERDPRCLTALARLAVDRFGSEAVTHIARLLQTTDNTRLQADLLEALGRTNGGLPVEELAAMYLEHDHHRVRGSAVLAVLRLARDASGIEAGLSMLSEMARSGDPLFRAGAAAVMGETALPLFLEAMEKLANDPDPAVGKIAIRSLGRLPTSGGLAALDRLRAHADPVLSALAAELVERASRQRLARIRSLMDGLTAGERQKLAHTIRSIEGSAGLDIVGRILRFDVAEAREGLTRILEQAAPETVELLRTCLISKAAPDGSPSLDPVWSWCRTPRRPEMPGWAPVIPLIRQLVRGSPSDVTGSALEPAAFSMMRLIIREADFLKSLLTGRIAGWSALDATTTVSRWSDRAVLCCKMVLLSTPHPETMLSAFDRLRGRDLFGRSVAQELLETNLDHELSALIMQIHTRLNELAAAPPASSVSAAALVPGHKTEELSVEEETALIEYLRTQENRA
ncbi:MAG TPA: HEAT repeat domain-containing protein [Candidatus Ozemobacteraceae bacterium]|nr:HEAT repeat domain-containing protein [Candidatus Ozemobacteraceae bacterium]